MTIYDIESGKEKQITNLGPGYRYNIYWSPDSEQVVFIDNTMTFHLCNVNTKIVTKIDQENSLYEWGLRHFEISWSKDSQWVAYAKTLDKGNSAIFVYNVKTKQRHQLTSGFYSDWSPIFDPTGEYLYFMTDRDFTALYSDFDNSWIYPNATQIAVATLRKDISSPLAPKNNKVEVEEKDPEDEEKEDKKKGKKDKDGDDDKKEEKEENIAIDIDGFERRMEILPIDPGNFGKVSATEGKVIFLRRQNTGSSEKGNTLKFFDLEEKEEKSITKDVNGFKVSADGKSLILFSQGSYAIIGVGADQEIKDKLATDEMFAVVNPRDEWMQIFNDAWRFQRDFFYDKDMHGVNWDEVKTRYGSLVDNAMSRYDLNFLIGEMIGELNASHTYRGGGDQDIPNQNQTGYLGVDWEMINGGYKIKKIIRGADWDVELRSPLDKPGVDVKEGDYVLAVNGVPMSEYSDPWTALEGTVGQTVELTVNNTNSTLGARKVLVEPIGSETRLRNLAWIESNRRKVDEMSNGKIGYIYVPSTGRDGQKELARMFYGQYNKEGLIIDERFNNGGQIPDRFVELLNRKPLAYFDVRDGKNWQWPPVAHFGPKAMLINGWSGSGGDAFPDYFKKAGLGPLIGTRTWGGVIGISGSPTLIDGGYVTVPTFRMYDPEGKWFAEGHGVEPDIEVLEDPSALAKGTDVQLEKAVQEVLRLMEEKGPIHPKVPSIENRNK